MNIMIIAFISLAGLMLPSSVFSETSSQETAQVIHVTDGDTIVVKIGTTIEKVRLIGIDAPELRDNRTSVAQCYAREATQRLTSLLFHKNIILVHDPLTHNRDTYGRLLRTVMLGTTSVNRLLVHDGFARAYTRFVFSEKVTTLNEQKNAQTNGRGLWSAKGCKGKI